MDEQSPPQGPPAFPPPPGPTTPTADVRAKPWWGLGDVVVGLLIVMAVATLAGSAVLPFLSSSERAAMSDGDSVPDLVLVVSLVAFQFSMWAWPVYVAKKKGYGATNDFGFWIKPIDIGLGFATAVVVFLAAAGVNFVVSGLVGLDVGAEESTNTEVLTEAGDRALLWIMAAAIIGAPLVEELFFRGLCLRAIQKRAGTVVAVIGSTVLFVLPHFTFSSSAGTIVLFASLGAVGIILAIVAVWVGRLGPSIIAHSLFNLVGALAVLVSR